MSLVCSILIYYESTDQQHNLNEQVQQHLKQHAYSTTSTYTLVPQHGTLARTSPGATDQSYESEKELTFTL